MMHRIIAAALVAAVAPLVASAQSCPTNADLTDGVRLTRLDPFFSIVQTQTNSGLAEARVDVRDGSPRSIESYYAHPMTVSRRVDSNGTLTLDYANDPEQIDQINRTMEWSSPVTLRSDGKIINEGTITISYLASGQQSIAGCSYDVWQLRDRLDLNGSQPIMFEKFYAPDLGLVVGAIRLNADGTPLSSVLFDEITAE